MGWEGATNSKHLTSTGDVTATTVKSRLYSVVLVPGSAASSVVVRTGGSGGTVIMKLVGAADTNGVVFSTNTPISAPTGIHATLAGTGAECVVTYA
jgi:hypothetical protein